jgi:hypothetical protein
METPTALDLALSALRDDKHLMYVEARVSGMKPAPAARIAGYKQSTHGYVLEKHPDIIAVMEAHYGQLRERVKVTHDQITDMFLDALPMVASATEQVQVAQALSRHMGFEQERTLRIKAEVEKSIHITGDLNVNTMHQLDEQQLLKLAGITEDDAPWIEGECSSG